MQMADEILSRLEIINPYVILAGGAPRDWLQNKPANDLDFYIHSTASTQRAFKKQITKALPEIRDLHTISRKTFETKERDVLYKTMPDLKAVWEGDVEGQKVQIMQMVTTKSLFEVVEQMDVSICQVWYKDGKIRKTNNYELGDKLDMMFLTNTDYNWCDPHPSKMRKYFPDKRCVESSEVVKIMQQHILNNKEL